MKLTVTRLDRQGIRIGIIVSMVVILATAAATAIISVSVHRAFGRVNTSLVR